MLKRGKFFVIGIYEILHTRKGDSLSSITYLYTIITKTIERVLSNSFLPKNCNILLLLRTETLKWESVGKLMKVFVYPVKSGKAISVQRAEAEHLGLSYKGVCDRYNKKFHTISSHSELKRIKQ